VVRSWVRSCSVHFSYELNILRFWRDRCTVQVEKGAGDVSGVLNTVAIPGQDSYHVAVSLRGHGAGAALYTI